MSSGNNPAVAMAWEGSRQMQSGELEAAVATLTEAIRLDPNRVHAYQVRAEAYRRLGNAAAAEADAATVTRMQDAGRRAADRVSTGTRMRFEVEQNDSLFSFEGTIGRERYVAHWGLSLILGFVGAALAGIFFAIGSFAAVLGAIILLVTFLVSVTIALAGAVKRVRDLGQPGELVLLGFIPIVGTILWLYLVFKEGEE
ncbi:MAG: DUF805 domain-containing protein [Chloroflexi bacterium]|nr:DUF805 domain-containing protein [Chloroflexota bacterium]